LAAEVGEVGERVREAREEAGLSPRELARRMGTSQAAVDRLGAGGVGATLTTLQRVASALGSSGAILPHHVVLVATAGLDFSGGSHIWGSG
jgi:transcriptional regulator with XRE-family HTH domain